MKIKYLLSVINTFLLINFVTAQESLIPNGGFENGTPKLDCEYENVQDFGVINNFIDDWFVPSVPELNIDQGSGPSPDWIDTDAPDCIAHWLSCGWEFNNTLVDHWGSGNDKGTPEDLPSSRFVLMRHIAANGFRENRQRYRRPRTHNHFLVELKQTLTPGASYKMRFNYIAYMTKITDVNSGINHLRVFLSEKDRKWWKGNQHQLLEPVTTNVVVNKPISSSCEWVRTERDFVVPTNLDELKFLVLFIEDGIFGIDDVVIFEQCPVEMLVENELFDDYFYAPPNSDTGPFSNNAANTLKAGRSVDPNKVDGPVIVEANADVTFRAGTRIELLPGFRTELGAKFVAEIAPCVTNNKTAPPVEPPVAEFEEFKPELPNPVSEREFQVFPNPNSGQFTLVLPKETHATARVFDMLGNVVYSAHLFGRQQSGIDISAMSKGIYFLHASQGDQVFTEKIIVK